jgi:hypothetical protein
VTHFRLSTAVKGQPPKEFDFKIHVIGRSDSRSGYPMALWQNWLVSVKSIVSLQFQNGIQTQVSLPVL